MNVKLSMLAIGISCLLSGCASQSDPRYSEQALDNLGEGISWNAAPDNTDIATRTTSLVELMPVAQVQSLIDEALQHNPSLQQTLITLKQSRVRESSANASRLPQASASFSGSKAESSDEVYNAALNVSWELDVWNRIGNSVSAAEFTSQSNAATLQSAQAMLAASVMQAYLDMITQQKILEIERRNLATLENSENVILDRYRAGLGTLNDLDTARTSSATSRANIAEYEYNLANSRRSLAVLLGRTDMSLSDITDTSQFPDVELPLASMPEQDLARRPDLMSAYYQIKANESSEKVAYKQLLPSLSISGALTDSGSTPAISLFKDPVWSLLGSVTAPLFQGGHCGPISNWPNWTR